MNFGLGARVTSVTYRSRKIPNITCQDLFLHEVFEYNWKFLVDDTLLSDSLSLSSMSVRMYIVCWKLPGKGLLSVAANPGDKANYVEREEVG